MDIMKRYFGPGLDLRIRLFNVLVSVSGCFCVIIAVASFFTDAELAGASISLAAAVGCFALLFFARHSERARLCHLLFIVGAFFILFPILFFRMGGYHGGIPVFLVFAIVFTVFMLEGRMALAVTALELALYLGMYAFAYMNPGSVSLFPTEGGVLASNMQDLAVVSVALGVTMYAQVRLYRAQQRRVGEQNEMLAQANRAKTEFLANASHEMRTPLTVISVNVQKVSAILEDMGEAVREPEAAGLLADAQGEIMRMSRMVDGLLKLAHASESAERGKTDLTALFRSTADTQQLVLARRRNSLEMEAEDGLFVFGDADLLSQALLNLIQNAHAHTEHDVIRLSVTRDGGTITTAVSDNGPGIPPGLLPRVFERGVTGKDGGTGFGLYFCKTVIESHGGEIWIEDGPGEAAGTGEGEGAAMGAREGAGAGKGTKVCFTLPVYEGQFGGAGN